MRIAVFSLGPVFQDQVHGGSQKTLVSVLRHLGELGHECTVFCPLRPDNNIAFDLAKRVRVKPVLRFKPTFPESYFTAPYNLTDIILRLREAVNTHDVFYIHDGELLFHFLYEDVPTAVAFQDFVYPDTLAGAFSFRRDRLIVASNFMKRSVMSCFTPFRKLSQSSVEVIPNGFDLDAFRRVDASRLRSELRLHPDAIAVLYPHRPDPRKGLFDALDVIHRVGRILPKSTYSRIRMLAPIWMDSDIAPESDHVYQGIYREAKDYAAERGLGDALVFHPWIPLTRMAEYYSAGVATLCIGNFIEAFGNVAVESELCGTPSIVARVGAQREVLPEELVRKIDHGDHDSAAEMLAQIIEGAESKTAEVRHFVARSYPEEKTRDGYARTIVETKLSSPAPSVYAFEWMTDDMLEIPPWCANLRSGYYNDYLYGYFVDRLLVSDLLQHLPSRFGELVRLGFDENRLKDWVNSGALVRVPARI